MLHATTPNINYVMFKTLVRTHEIKRKHVAIEQVEAEFYEEYILSCSTSDAQIHLVAPATRPSKARRTRTLCLS
jgi:hypothetical protein